MSRITWQHWLLCGLVAVMPWLTTSARAEDPAPEAPRATRVRTAPPEGLVRVFTGEGEETLVGEYWLGIALATLPDVAKQQLGIENGLAVADVTADSPATKAGVKKHDILIKAGDVSLKSPSDLVRAVNAAKDKELALTLLRGGKEMVVKATPVKRSEAVETGKRYTLRVPQGEIREEIKRLEEALQSLKSKAGGDSLGLFFARPGVVAPPIALPKPAELPKGMAISISKEADKPAKIHVKKDDKEWDVTEDKLADLPEDVRAQVQKFLQGMTAPGIAAAAARSFLGGPKVAPVAPVPPIAPAVPVPPAAGVQSNRVYSYRVEGGASLEGKLDTIVKKLDELRKDVDELKAKK